MKRKKTLILVSVGLCLIVAAGVFVHHLPKLIDSRIRSILSAYGVEEFDSGLPHWGLSGIETKTLRATGNFEGWGYKFTVEDVELNYHWRMLLRGKLYTLTLNKVNLELVSNHSQKKTPPKTNVEVPDFLDYLAAFSLPLESIIINNTHLTLSQNKDENIVISGKEFKINNLKKSLSGIFTVNYYSAFDNKHYLAEITLEKNKMSWIPLIKISLFEGNEAFAGMFSITIDKITRRALVGFHGSYKNTNLATRIADLTKNNNARKYLDKARIEIIFDGEFLIPNEIVLAEHQWAVDGFLKSNINILIDSPGVEQMGARHSSIQANFSLQGNAKKIQIGINNPVVFESELEVNYWKKMSSLFPWKTSPHLFVSLDSDEKIIIQLVDFKPSEVFVKGLKSKWELGNSEQTLLLQARVERFKKIEEKIKLKVDGMLTFTGNKNNLAAINFNGMASSQQENWQGNGDYNMDGWQIEGTWDGVYRADGQMTVSTATRLASLNRVVERLKESGFIPLGLTLASGSAKIYYGFGSESGRGNNVENNLHQQVRIFAEDVSGLYDGVAFSGGVLSGEVEKEKNWKSLQSLAFNVESVRTGVELSNISSRITLKNSLKLLDSHWRLDSFDADIFSGEMALSKPVNFDFPFSGNTIPITLSNWNLGDILKIYQDQGLSGTGILSGKVPVTLDINGISIKNGSIFSVNSGGKINYNPSGAGEAVRIGNEQLTMTLRLLENFKYDTLKVSTNVDPSGEMLLGLQLWGRNPAEFDGRDVNFNINIEENLYDLFKVLKLTDDVTRKIEKRIQGNYP